jgi:hypothetical protein
MSHFNACDERRMKDELIHLFLDCFRNTERCDERLKNIYQFKIAIPLTNDIFKRVRQDFKYIFVGVSNIFLLASTTHHKLRQMKNAMERHGYKIVLPFPIAFAPS